jgi:hypothetical protein
VPIQDESNATDGITYLEEKEMNRSLASLAIFVAAALPVFAEDAPIESRYDLSFKCVSDKKGGYNPSASGLSFTQFYGQEEFFVTHYSDVPIYSLVDESDIDIEKGMTENWWRKAMSSHYIEQDEYSESGSYYLRDASLDPKYSIFLWTKCTAMGSYNSDKEEWEANPANITCTAQNKVFQMSTKTGRFASASLGSWIDGKTEMDGEAYYGDSAILAMGQCKVYYP